MARLLLVLLAAALTVAFAPIQSQDAGTIQIKAEKDISEYATLTTKQARKRLRRRLKRRKCSLARTGSVRQQKRCVRKRIRRIDPDKDGIIKKNDNCLDTANTDQANNDGDNYGDSCDNCPATPNNDQADVDVDGSGDVCDLDIDSSM